MRSLQNGSLDGATRPFQFPLWGGFFPTGGRGNLRADLGCSDRKPLGVSRQGGHENQRKHEIRSTFRDI